MRKKILLFVAVNMMLAIPVCAKVFLQSLKVEYAKTPLAVSVAQPRFSWQMMSDDKMRGCQQKAYQITVVNENGNQVWNTGKVNSDVSLNVKYSGNTLLPATKYKWMLKVWNQNNKVLSDSSFFETALVMTSDYNHTIRSAGNGTLEGWEGAKWIGRSDDAVMFYAPYFPVFRLNCDILLDKKSKTTKASLLFGANDPRLMDYNKNLLGVANKRDSSYIRIELDVAALKGDKEAQLNVYRKGYKRGETDTSPVASFCIPASIINKDNMYAVHKLSISVNAGSASLYIDNAKKEIGKLVLNPTGKRGGDYIAYPVVADLGCQLEPRQKATFSNIEVCNYKAPHNVITCLDEPVVLDGSATGLLSTFALKENTAPMLRTVFSLQNKKIAKARLYATARGIYDIYINGKSVSKAYFNPGSMQYNRTQIYQTFDVTRLLDSGDNAVGAILSEGWWSGGATYIPDNWNFFGDRQSLLAKLQVTYDDGTTQTIVTDPKTWTAYNDGAVRYGSFFMGEVYDARKEKSCKDWATASYDAKNWQPAVEVDNGDFKISPDYQMLPDMADGIMPVDTLTAKTVTEVRKGVFVYDLGQNMAGVPLVKFRGLKPGQAVRIRTAEVKYPDLPGYKDNAGMIMTENLRLATSQDVYIASGDDVTYSPRFTLHGFRYMEITGIDKPLDTQDVKAVVLSSMTAPASSYTTSNASVNRLAQNIVWSTRSNFMSVPTDCPQRNERLGWMGDISVFSRSATYITDASNFLRRYLISVRDMQSPQGQFPDVAPTGCGFGGLLWGSAGITVPWELYQQYGDTAMLSEHYSSMKRYIEFVLSDYIDKHTGIIVQHHAWGDLGDWLSPVYDEDDKSLIWECYFIYDLDIMSKMAKVLGKYEDAKWYAELAGKRRQFFKDTYLERDIFHTRHSAFDPKKEGQTVDTQTSYLLPLALNVVDGKVQKAMEEHLADAVKRPADGYPAYSLLTGFIGTAWISEALTFHGMSDIAYRLLLQEDYPSWLYPVKNGATTVWERLNSYTVKDGFGKNNSMNSFNHYSFGAVASWMFASSLGIRRDEGYPGFKHFFLMPKPDTTGGITHAEGYYASMYGRIESAWRRDSDTSVTEYDFTVPANTTATLLLDATPKAKVTEGGKTLKRSNGVKLVVKMDSLYKIELQPGNYKFKVEP